jgi:hypothetical protein
MPESMHGLTCSQSWDLRGNYGRCQWFLQKIKYRNDVKGSQGKNTKYTELLVVAHMFDIILIINYFSGTRNNVEKASEIMSPGLLNQVALFE